MSIQKIKLGLQSYNFGDPLKLEHNFVLSGYPELLNRNVFIDSGASQTFVISHITSQGGMYIHYVSCTVSGVCPVRVGFWAELYPSTPLKLYTGEAQLFRPGSSNMSTIRLITTSGYGAYVQFVAFGV